MCALDRARIVHFLNLCNDLALAIPENLKTEHLMKLVRGTGCCDEDFVQDSFPLISAAKNERERRRKKKERLWKEEVNVKQNENKENFKKNDNQKKKILAERELKKKQNRKPTYKTQTSLLQQQFHMRNMIS